MTTLVIVESPGKVKKLSALLGASYKVMASVGHVRDLPQRELGIQPPDFKPAYEPTERGKGVLSKLRQGVTDADRVLLATDPDREGEAIAWHLADALKLQKPERVTFTAITKEQVLAAVASPRPIDMERVRAQEARRVLDRIVGYRVSPALSERSGQNLSAGRVQSPAVRLVVDREREIAAFKVTEHYGAELVFNNGDGTSWKAAWDTKPHLAEGQQYLLDDALAQIVAGVREVTVATFADSEKGRAPAAPFTTSTLQQAAGQRLKFKPKKTMELAQRLYEQGVITYHRTDAPNMDLAGMDDIAAYAQGAGLPLAEKPRRWKAKEGAQEGHEAIRPTHAGDLEAGETTDEQALYRLIWQRAVASQLADAMYAVRTVTLAGEIPGDTQGVAVTFLANGRTLQSQGWLAVYADDAADDDEESASSNPIPHLAEGAALTAAEGRLLTKCTKPPTRFTEATLVKELERLGIGRPSTYAAILDNITSRAYVTEGAKGYLIPSPIGESIRDALVGRFGFADLDYTRELENQLDLIAEAKADYHMVVSSAWSGLDGELAALDAVEFVPANPCPECGKALRRIKGSYGFFWSCTGYPDCKTSLPDAKGKPGERKAPPALSGIPCPKCGKDLARRQGVSKPKKRGLKGRPYDFYSCTGFPKCDAKYDTGADGKPAFPPEGSA
ncbi:type I DNA topoisomerase [Shinella yambaruensis]|uniref:DNA topoisomerase 1 n=1 Tax=Shinella yambaruensis TaxID=415996 RepID=A0ABQ5ZTX7_9HYPH|nr:type I DNA topoisomerase [Shinella yambaruensis]MCJ8029986.1 type I DNA topoisomerase [Shinella yambaruensis]MCU7984216.1 type I DNA topoisomerase [Shinella yambaruensis]GLR55187.1 DNA topoisomerase 1 [Shinella yambaruensis]